MFKNKAKKYCIAAGCRNTDKNWGKSFFSVPELQKDIERRRTWLTLLGREDLKTANVRRSRYYVCSAHFDESARKTVKQLKENAVPTKFLANQPHEEASGSKECEVNVNEEIPRTDFSSSSVEIDKTIANSNEAVLMRDTATQTNEAELSEQDRTSKLVTEGKPRKRKLLEALNECKQIHRSLSQEIRKIREEMEAKTILLSIKPEPED